MQRGRDGVPETGAGNQTSQGQEVMDKTDRQTDGWTACDGAEEENIITG